MPSRQFTKRLGERLRAGAEPLTSYTSALQAERQTCHVRVAGQVPAVLRQAESAAWRATLGDDHARHARPPCSRARLIWHQSGAARPTVSTSWCPGLTSFHDDSPRDGPRTSLRSTRQPNCVHHSEKPSAVTRARFGSQETQDRSHGNPSPWHVGPSRHKAHLGRICFQSVAGRAPGIHPVEPDYRQIRPRLTRGRDLRVLPRCPQRAG